MAVGDKVLGAEAHWMMGRVMPRQFLDGIGEYLDLEAPEREDELIMAVRARAEELADADRDLVVDEPSKGALAISAVVLAAFEQLIPLFDGDERRKILFLQHVVGTVLKRPYQLMFQTLSKREEPLGPTIPTRWSSALSTERKAADRLGPECFRSVRKPGPHRFPERSAPIAQRREFACRRRRELSGSPKQVGLVTSFLTGIGWGPAPAR